jgi:hypothetical protein
MSKITYNFTSIPLVSIITLSLIDRITSPGFKPDLNDRIIIQHTGGNPQPSVRPTTSMPYLSAGPPSTTEDTNGGR